MTNREYIYDTRQLRYTSQNVLNAQEAVALVVPVYLNLYRPFYIRAETSLPIYLYISLCLSQCGILGQYERLCVSYPGY